MTDQSAQLYRAILDYPIEANSNAFTPDFSLEGKAHMTVSDVTKDARHS
jgi:hypothetical protein